MHYTPYATKSVSLAHSFLTKFNLYVSLEPCPTISTSDSVIYIPCKQYLSENIDEIYTSSHFPFKANGSLSKELREVSYHPLYHTLSEYFYVFPPIAYTHWRPNIIAAHYPLGVFKSGSTYHLLPLAS